MKRFPPDHPMTRAWQVLASRHATAVAGGLASLADHPAVLRDTAIRLVLDLERPARLREAAARALAGRAQEEDAIATETCAYLLDFDPSPLVRRAVIPGVREAAAQLRRLRFDSSWLVRATALQRGADATAGILPQPFSLPELRVAASDPHWRVRSALVGILEERQLLPDWHHGPREDGVCEFMAWTRAPERELPKAEDESRAKPSEQAAWWDDDPRVLLAHLRERAFGELHEHIPDLFQHQDEPIRRWVLGQLLEKGSASLCAAAVASIKDPRLPSWNEATELVRRLDSARRPPWPPDLETITPPALKKWNGWSAEHPQQRSLGEATEIDKESSWSVLLRAGLRAEQLLPLEPVRTRARVPEPLIQLPERSECEDRTEERGVRLAVSGHYHLPTAHYVAAFEAGVRDFFWEPNYSSFNTFVRRLSSTDRARLRLITGTFEATPDRIEKDLAYALRTLAVERIDTFLLFWVRSDARLTTGNIERLVQLKDEGRTRQFGLSTHQRELALRHIKAGRWDTVMVRHNAAHRGAESALFPAATEQGQRLFTFSSTCYGRLIRAGISARDCLRFSLRHACVDLVMTAPATREQLEENLSALLAPALTAEELAHIRECGDHVYRRNKAFQKWIRSR